MKKLLLLVALVGGLSFFASQTAEAGYGYGGGFGGGYRSAGYGGFGGGYRTQNFGYRNWGGYGSYGGGYGYQGGCYHGGCDYNYIPSYPVYGGCGY